KVTASSTKIACKNRFIKKFAMTFPLKNNGHCSAINY
ncbi:MAG: hypothetical protein ACI8Q3_000977, partial [Marinomonas primoryensis]